MKYRKSLGKTTGNQDSVMISMTGSECSSEERFNQISEAAYYKAEARGFAPGHELEDWLAAEAEEKSWQLH